MHHRILAPLVGLWCIAYAAYGQLRENAEGAPLTIISMRSPAVRSSKIVHDVSRIIAAPTLLIGAGLYSITDSEWLNKYEVKEERDEWMPLFSNHLDDYLQFAPIAGVYGLNLAGVKGKNDLANRTALLIKSELIVGVLAYSLKRITAVPRPDTGEPTSMPSGHTAQAFFHMPPDFCSSDL